ncbi:ABC transporter ATP-binding protein [Saccharopolyspora pogona]|uniref:ABC transporter ATP-binding protein n=1 Tax=Saccharopolyspora pogona TaxID=333966 RepID=UPI001CC22804|nr:ATP-binding cassette domain-containing protein [Saccharopolyspora pogona]
MTVQGDSVFAIDDVVLRRQATPVLDHVSARIPAAACTAVVGRSGAGKSTLLRLLTRLDDPDTGQIAFRGIPLARHDVLDLRRRVQLVAQQPVLLSDSVVDEIRLGRPQLGRADVACLLSRVGLPSSLLDRTTAGLSGGEAQRVCLARALALEPEVLLLDEPTAALDAASAAAIDDTVRAHVNRGGTAVLVSHNTAQVDRVADHVIVMDNGHVRACGPPDVIRNQETAP